jgi:hypothetical protein
MTHTDFSDWVTPDLVLTLGGRTYTVHPPDVARSGQVVALAVQAEHDLGLAAGPVPADMAATIDAIIGTPLGDVTLGVDVHRQMQDDGLDPATINRMAYYALLFWARGKQRADRIAVLMWTPKPEQGESADGGGAGPKAAPRRRPPSGRRSASVSPTPTAGIPTTAPSRPS